MARITRHPRYHPEDYELDHRLHFTNKIWVSNIFRAYEWLFGRGQGIRIESSASPTSYTVYTLEALFCLIEVSLREFISKKLFPFKIYSMRFIPNPNYIGKAIALPGILLSIGFDNHSSGDTGSAASSLTYSETCSGSNLILWASAQLYQSGPDTTGDKLTGITYNSVSMSQEQKGVMPGGTYNRYAYLYMLVNPSTGSDNIVMSASDSTNRIIGVSASYSGAKQTGQPDASTINTSTGTSSIASALTTIADKCWEVSVMWCASATYSSVSNATLRDNAQFQGVLADSNGDITPAGSYTITWTANGNTEFNVLQASFVPILVTEPSEIVNINTAVHRASRW